MGTFVVEEFRKSTFKERGKKSIFHFRDTTKVENRLEATESWV